MARRGPGTFIHTTKIELLSLSLPVAVIAIDEAVLPLVVELATRELVTTEDVQIATR